MSFERGLLDSEGKLYKEVGPSSPFINTTKKLKLK